MAAAWLPFILYATKHPHTQTCHPSELIVVIFVGTISYPLQLQKARQLLANPISTDIVFAAMWAVLFVLYLPAANAGFVADFTGWLDQTLHYGFWDNINRTHYKVQSLYQFTQLNTWLFFQLAGARPWPWHLLFITLHAANASLLYRLCVRLLKDSGVASASVISLAGTLLFAITPYAAEVVVWEPSFHYLQGMLLLLLILNWSLSYIHTEKKLYLWLAGISFLLSTFSLEIFYITPWLLLGMAVFYRLNDSFSKRVFTRVVGFIFLPQLLMFGMHLVIFKITYGAWIAHIGNGAVSTALQDGLGKPAKHLFHTLFMGRFFSNTGKHMVYAWADSIAGLIMFYGLVVAACAYIALRFRSMQGKGRVASLLFVWMLITLALLVPLWFGDIMLIVYDRYTYFTNAFVYMLLSLMVSFISVAFIRIAIISLFTLINLRFAIQVSRYWMKSERIVHSLLHTFPYNSNKPIILLNLPQNMQGAAMIGAEQESEFRMMHDGLLPGQPIKTTVYDAMAYNLLTPADGAHVTVLNDSTLQVTLNQWGTWWWYGMQGGHSYANAAYSINMKDIGHLYELTLKQPAAGYLILFQVGDQWKTVDMGKTGLDQN